MRPSSTEKQPQPLRSGNSLPAARCARPGGVRSLRRLAAAVFATGLLLPAAVAGAEPESGSLIIGDPGQSAAQQQSTSQSNDQGTAGAITLGDTTQSNDQQATTDQVIAQEQSGTFVILNGALHQTANQNANTVQENSQHSGGLVIGDVLQSNVQHAATSQDINQVMDGTFIVLGNAFQVDSRIVDGVNTLNGCAVCADSMQGGPVLAGGDYRQTGGSNQSLNGVFIVFGDFEQSASQNSSTVENNQQDRSGFIILGDTEQANDQQAVTNQEIDQSLIGTFIVFGTLDQTADQNAETIQTNDQDQG
jgi:hypothetical protein